MQVGATLTKTRSTGIYCFTLLNESDRARVWSLRGNSINADIPLKVGESKTFGLLQGYIIPSQGKIVVSSYNNNTFRRSFTWDDK